MTAKPVICLMGPTASGKTDIATRLADIFSFDLVSVDSALVYRGMDIGTAKPDADTLRSYPHRLIDIRDPEDSYSAGDFVRDAHAAIDAIVCQGKTPLLVGGTMMYFRSLINGIADLPQGDLAVRAEIDREAAEDGWPTLHKMLSRIDPVSASKINPNDSQRIQRALEVFRLSGRSRSDWHKDVPLKRDLSFTKIAIVPDPRSRLHARIEMRLNQMLEQGFLQEIEILMARPKLDADSASMRSVGYRQFWTYLSGEGGIDDARDRALAATRQLAKRQLTWLRNEQDLFLVNPLEVDALTTISKYLEKTAGLTKTGQGN